LRAVDAVLGNLAVAGQAKVVEALHLGSHCEDDVKVMWLVIDV
jgi:hypothetical protein